VKAAGGVGPAHDMTWSVVAAYDRLRDVPELGLNEHGHHEKLSESHIDTPRRNDLAGSSPVDEQVVAIAAQERSSMNRLLQRARYGG